MLKIHMYSYYNRKQGSLVDFRQAVKVEGIPGIKEEPEADLVTTSGSP